MSARKCRARPSRKHESLTGDVMQESLHDVLPFPYFLYAKYTQLPPLEGVSILRRQFEDATALAGVIAAAVQQEEAEEGDIRHALRLLAGHPPSSPACGAGR